MTGSPVRHAIDVGSIIDSTYLLEVLIGRGGMGSVYAASHVRLPGKKLAVKLLHAELVDDEVLARFRREAEITARLGHPNIVQINDYNVSSDGIPYLVLEYLHGQTLAQKLAAGPLAFEQAMSITRQVGSALATAHREGIVHRDLKPQNVFLVPTEVEGRVVEIAKVLDFGISKLRNSDTVKTLDSALLGTPQYMSPEQATGQHSVIDERTDVFALGAMVYEMLCGHPAFSGASIPEVVFKVVYEQPAPLAAEAPGIPAAVVDAVAQAMAKKSSERFPTVTAFVETLTGVALPNLKPPTMPPPIAGFASGSKRVVGPGAPQGGDAFAQTVGSGDHGPAVLAAAALGATVASMPGAANSAAATPAKRAADAMIASASTAFPSADARAAVRTDADRAAAPADTAARTVAKRSPAPWIFGGIVVLAAAAVAIVMITRTPPTAASHAARTPRIDAGIPAPIVAAADAGTSAIAATQPPHAPADAAIAAAIPARDAGAHAVATASPRPDGATKKAATTAGSADAADEPEAGDDREREAMKHAEEALKSGNLTEAMHAANIGADSSAPVVRAHAATIRGIIYCRQQDQENASAQLRATRNRFQRGRIMQACRAAGTNLSSE